MLGLALFAQMAIGVAVADTVQVGEPFTLVATVRLTGTRLPQMRAPDFAPFAVVRSEAIPRFQRATWLRGASVEAEYRYVLQAQRSGTVTVGSFRARLDTQIVRSTPVRIVVREGVPAALPAIVTRARLDTTVPVNFRAMALPETVYVGQQSMYQVGMFIDETVRGQLRRNPDFFAPEMRSMLAYDLPVRHAMTPVKRVGGRRYEAHVFQRALFPLAAGRYALPPAQLVYSLAYTPSFFSREETHELRTDSTVIIALDPPDEGKPADFFGAVGQLRIETRIDTGVARVGDPMLLTTRVSGDGNVKLLPRPRFTVPWASIVASEERVSVDSVSAVIRGNKEFDWVLTPRVAGSVTLPSVSYPYFDPQTRRYAVTQSAPETLSIQAGSLAALDSVRADTTSVLAIRTTFRGEGGEPLHARPLFWLILALVPIPAAVVAAASRWRPMRRADPARRRLRSLSGRKSSDRIGTIRRVYVNALGERLMVSSEELSRRGALARALRRVGVTRETAAGAEQLLRELDVASYSGSGAPPDRAAARAYDLYRRIDAEAVERDALTGRVLPVIIACVISASALLALADQGPAQAAFEEGIAAYRARDFTAAEQHFANAAERAPRAPDAWANYGTAAWTAGHAAEATVGWQRALRLEPLALDVRERLGRMRGWQRGNIEWVPPVPPAPLAVTGASLWILAWVMVLLRASRRVTRLRWWGPAFALLGAVTVVAAMQADRILAAEDLAVVTIAGPLRALPALGSDRLATIDPGQVVRTLELRSQWALIALGPDREGWVERNRVRSIARAE